MSRRGVLTGAAAIAGMTALPEFLQAADTPRRSIGHVVVDERLTHPVSIASGAGPRVHTVSALDDLCHRWYTQLRRTVLADAGHIAGLTTWMDYVVMQGCAAEIGYAERRVSAYPDLSVLLLKLKVRESWAHVRTVTWVFSPRSI